MSKRIYNRSTYKINASKNQDLASITDQSWRALISANNPSVLYDFAGRLVRVDASPETIRLRDLDVNRMVHALSGCATWWKKDKREQDVLTRPPRDVAINMLATPNPPLPKLERIVRVPIFASDGTLQITAGYLEKTRTYLAFASSLSDLPEVSTSPAEYEIEIAREVLMDDVLGDFPFVSPADKANALGLILLPFARALIKGPTPLAMISKPLPATGGSLLATACAFPFLGSRTPVVPAPGDEPEWQRTILANLLLAPAYIVIDNLPQTALKSPALASAITSDLFSGRDVGKSRLLQAPVRCGWVGTGNNPSLSDELRRRACPIWLDAKTEHPARRAVFRHPRLLEWLANNHSFLVWAVLTFIQAWVAAGQPDGSRTFAGFESYAAVLGGILDVARVSGFLHNLDATESLCAAETLDFRAFLLAWKQKFGDQVVGVTDLLSVAGDLSLGDGDEQSRRIRLGKLLYDRRGVTIADHLIEDCGQYQGSRRYRLRRVDEPTRYSGD